MSFKMYIYSTCIPIISLTFSPKDNINLDIHKGELFTILGGSGCGKSTLLRMIAGIELPESGSIEVDGHEMNGVAANERPINMMFQSYAVFPHMNVFKNIDLVITSLQIPMLTATSPPTLPHALRYLAAWVT